MLTEKRKTRLWLIAAVLLAVFLFTACASGASRVSEKIELGQKYLTELYGSRSGVYGSDKNQPFQH